MAGPLSRPPMNTVCEKLLKKYQRDWKINLIERDNPHRNDLYMALVS
jgi:predicted GIY-YIG superfamily endonuclease